MSSLPALAQEAQCSNKFIANAIERTDETLLTDDEVYQLKGGDNALLLKTAAGLASVFAFVALTGKAHEFKTFSVQFSTFIWSNILFIGTASLFQSQYLTYTGNKDRYRAHQLALYHRFVLNMSYVKENKKKPKFH